MRKKGTAELIGAGIILFIMLVGGVASYTILAENRYVGDKTTLKVFDLTTCDISPIEKVNRVSFDSVEEAKRNGYTLATCT